nr:CBS domain-containing protein CBSX3, mitochondrial-like [Physcomitrium patens]|eukprot:XP_024365746.1 CBS domain-containing protein CBSX3, mitochondrial-like [Physcomitrella patens]
MVLWPRVGTDVLSCLGVVADEFEFLSKRSVRGEFRLLCHDAEACEVRAGSGRTLSGSVLQHVRVGGSALGFGIQTRRESGQIETRESLVEHRFESTTIADVLKDKGQKADGSWLWCSVEDTVYDAVKSMTANNVEALLVVKSGTEKMLAGIITERVKTSRNLVTFDQRVKLMEMIVLYYDDPYLLFMQNKLITVSPDTKVLRAMELMTDNRIRHIPVVEDKKMKGMVSIGDVVRAVLDEHREELQSLNSYIQGGY